MEDLDLILDMLFKVMPEYRNVPIPEEKSRKRELMRSLMNIFPPTIEMSDDFFIAQNSELVDQLLSKGIIDADSIKPTGLNSIIKLWQGDITRLKVDAIVNAANSAMLGCFVPLHGCIDNAIHSAAGIQLRMECDRLMREQGYPEPTGKAKITNGYNLPAKYVIHTVGPIISMDVAGENEKLLASCYRSCLEIAEEYNLKSIAFCCISTGEFRFPNQLAAEIAVDTVMKYLAGRGNATLKTVVFNVFKDIDYDIYKKLLK